MYAENYILIDSEAIRAEYTYYVYFKHLPEHEAYFNRNSFLSQSTVQSVQRSTVQSKRRGIMASARESIDVYEN